MTMWINPWMHWHALSLSMCYTEKYTQTFTQHEEVVWTWAWKEIIYCYTNRKHVGWNKRANIHAIFLLCTYSYFYDYYFSFMVFKWDYSNINFKYKCFQPLGKGLLKEWYWLRNRRLMLISADPSSCCEILFLRPDWRDSQLSIRYDRRKGHWTLSLVGWSSETAIWRGAICSLANLNKLSWLHLPSIRYPCVKWTNFVKSVQLNAVFMAMWTLLNLLYLD